MNSSDYKVILFYKFVAVKNPQRLMKEQRKLCGDLGLKGRMLIAEEGVNATFEGKVKDVKKYEREMKKIKLFKDVVFKESEGNGMAFTRLEIKVRDEVVTLGAGKFNIKKETAPTISAKELDKMYESGEDFVVLDLRNDYEIAVGAFENTAHLDLKNFRELPEKMKDLEHLKKKKVIAVCTGDIRCEKGTCLLKREGFENLYHLEDGIHNYMQKFPGRRFKGSLFVFDNRMTTPVVDTVNREIIGQCIYCSVKCEDFYSDDTTRPSRKVICCVRCAKKYKDRLRKCVT